MKITDRILILRTIKHSESDLIVHGLSASRGRVNFIAKGALKSKKRFGGGILEPTHFIEATYKQKSSASESVLHFLEEAKLLKGFEALRTDYDRLNMAFHSLQLVSKMAVEEDIHTSEELFNLVGNFLKTLETSNNLELLCVHFEAKVLASQGVMPQNLPDSDLFQLPLSEHEKSKITQSQLKLMGAQIHVALKSYLEGLNPVD